jgi:hypothetical protein
MSALWIELKKGFTNEGVVHELSWIPGVQTGGVLSSNLAGKGIDLWQKKRNPAQSFTFLPLLYSFFGISLAYKSFSGISPR